MRFRSSRPYSVKTFRTRGSQTVLFFICPFGTKSWQLTGTIRKLQKAGYIVVSYDATKDVFYAGQPEILERIITGIKQDIKSQIQAFQKEGIQDFGFFGSSLGTFILYNCIGDIKELKWGVFNTGGNIAKAMWNFKKARKRHEAKRISFLQLEKAWHHLQHPSFANLKGHRFMFVSSTADKIVPLDEIEQYLPPIRKAGAKISIQEVPARGHVSAVIAGLRQAPELLNKVRIK